MDMAAEPETRFPTCASSNTSHKYKTYTLSKIYLYTCRYLYIKMDRSAGTHVDMAAEPEPRFPTFASSNS